MARAIPSESPAYRAMCAVPREKFLPPELRPRAGEDNPLPLGWGQTISQPSLVAYMTDQLALSAQSRVLEIGTGSGFQTAVLASLAAEVFTIELLPPLAAGAQVVLAGLGYRNVHYRVGDGSLGWPEAAPFDAIIVTAAAERVPPALVQQFGPGGRLVIPVGPPQGPQRLWLVEKLYPGSLRETDLLGVRFVPLVTA